MATARSPVVHIKASINGEDARSDCDRVTETRVGRPIRAEALRIKPLCGVLLNGVVYYLGPKAQPARMCAAAGPRYHGTELTIAGFATRSNSNKETCLTSLQKLVSIVSTRTVWKYVL